MKSLTLVVSSLILTLAAVQKSAANQQQLKEVKMRNLSVCFLFAPSAPNLFIKDPSGNYARLQIDTVHFASWNSVAADTALDLYKQKITPETKVVDPITKQEKVTPASVSYETVTKWIMPAGEDPVRKLFYFGRDGKVLQRDIEYSTEKHSALQLRVINLSGEPAIIRIAGQQVPIPRESERFFKPASQPNEVFTFQFGAQIKDSPYISPVRNLKFYKSSERLTILIAYRPEERSENGAIKVDSYTPADICFYEDTETLPTNPKPVPLATTR